MSIGSVVVCIPLHNELTRRGEFVLRRSLDSLGKCRDELHARRPDINVCVACCDDASTDATPEFVSDFFAGWDHFRLVRYAVAQGAGTARNTAAAQFAADVVCFLDADDQYHDRHLWLGIEALESWRGQDGQPFAAISTLAALSVDVHPQWESRISRTIPITKFIRRDAWEFVEGMPASDVYQLIGCEDQSLMRMIAEFFEVAQMQERTVTYWSYPNSSFARQHEKFRRPPGHYVPSRDDPPEFQFAAQIMIRQDRSFLEYLRAKRQEPAFGFAAIPFAKRQPSSQPINTQG